MRTLYLRSCPIANVSPYEKYVDPTGSTPHAVIFRQATSRSSTDRIVPSTTTAVKTYSRTLCSSFFIFHFISPKIMSPAPKINKIFSDKLPELSEKEEDLLHQVKNVRTTPRDNRFPSHNQALHCWNRYNEWILCMKETGKDEDKCQVYRQYAVSICPGDWTDNWDEARGEGSFQGLNV